MTRPSDSSQAAQVVRAQRVRGATSVIRCCQTGRAIATGATVDYSRTNETAFLLVALLPASACIHPRTSHVRRFCGELVAAERAPRIAWTMNLRGERNIWTAEALRGGHTRDPLPSDTGQSLAALAISPMVGRGVRARRRRRHTPNPASLQKPPKRQVFAAAADGRAEPAYSATRRRSAAIA